MISEELQRYQPLREIRKTLRFATYQGFLNDQKVFIKVALQEKLKPKLVLEASGLINMQELDSLGRYYKTPTVIDLTPNAIVTSWAEGKTMADDFTDGNSDISKHLDYLLNLYDYIDSRTSGSSGATRFNRPGKVSGTDDVLEKLTALKYEEKIDANLIQSMAHFIRRSLSGLETRFTNGDLQPGNLLIDHQDLVTVIDCESCSWLWPRHYNVVNFVFNYGVTRPWLRPFLEQFLTDYCHRVGVDLNQERDAFNVIAAMRCLQLVYEELGSFLEEKPEGGHLKPDVRSYIEQTMQRINNNELFIEA